MKKHYKSLELNSVLEMLANEATCADARELALGLMPTDNINEAEMLLSQTEDAFSLLARFGAPSFSGLCTVNNPLQRAAAGGAPPCSESPPWPAPGRWADGRIRIAFPGPPAPGSG